MKKGSFLLFYNGFSRLFNLCLPDVEKSSYFSFSFHKEKCGKTLHIRGRYCKIDTNWSNDPKTGA